MTLEMESLSTTVMKFANSERPALGCGLEIHSNPLARTLGGCSTHNAGVALRPINSDWNGIAAFTVHHGGK